MQAVTSVLVDRGFDITEHQQFDDSVHGQLYLRTCFRATDGDTGAARGGLRNPRRDIRMHCSSMTPAAAGPGDGSKFGHCLNDLIFRWRAGSLGGEHRRRRLQP